MARLHGGELTLDRQRAGAQKHHCLAAGRAGTDCGMKRARQRPKVLVRKAAGAERSRQAASSATKAPTLAARDRDRAALLSTPKAARARVAEWLAALKPAEAKLLKALLADTSDCRDAAGKLRRKFALSMGLGEPRTAASAAPAAGRSRRAFDALLASTAQRRCGAAKTMRRRCGCCAA